MIRKLDRLLARTSPTAQVFIVIALVGAMAFLLIAFPSLR